MHGNGGHGGIRGENVIFNITNIRRAFRTAFSAWAYDLILLSAITLKPEVFWTLCRSDEIKPEVSI